jgi:hypothetical protein
VQAVLHGGGAQRLVVPARAGEVLKQVPERLLGNDAQIDRQAGVRQGLGARGARGVHDVDGVEGAEVLDQGLRVTGRGDDVEVLDGIHPAPGAARQLYAQGGGMLAQARHQLLADCQRLRQEQPDLWAPIRSRLQLRQQLLLGLRPKARHVGQPAGFGGRAQVLEGRDAEVLVQEPGALGSEAGDVRDGHETGRDAGLELVS